MAAQMLIHRHDRPVIILYYATEAAQT